jgi:hypothetical protein
VKLLVFGLDAADPKILFDYLDEFPNFRRLVEGGTSGRLEGYCLGYGSYDNWASIYSGMSPHRRGPFNISPTGCGLPRAEDITHLPKFWDILNQHGFSTAVVRALMTDPPQALDGYMLGGDAECLFKPTSTKYSVFHPKDAELESLLCGEIPDPPVPATMEELGTSWEEAARDPSVLSKLLSDDCFADFLDYMSAECDYWANNLPRLQRARPTDLMFFYLASIDRLQHFQLHEEGWHTVRRGYQLIDQMLGRLLDELEPENVLILSDHGQEPFHMLFPEMKREVQQEALAWPVRAWREDGRIFGKSANGAPFGAIHCLHGIHLFHGRDIQAGQQLEGHHVIDIFPTLLRFFDIECEGEGVAMPVFKDRSRNTSTLAPPRFEKIAVVQTLSVARTQRVVSEINLRFRGARIDVLGHARFGPAFLHDPRVTEFIPMEGLETGGSMTTLRSRFPDFDRFVVPVPDGDQIQELWI